ncbi:hypothetical protein [Staphylospora marina]|uniref:hypothetical protein n=1 Tax=Staphylospora marina TaxID=2490858 RepID=UPI000F5C1BC4|nr:hypothetical protein [Staphylospora marina]
MKDRNRKDRKKDYRELKTVESMRSEMVPEEFTDGPYGAATHPEKLGKQSPVHPEQHASPRFTYEMREFHEDLPRVIPGSHPTHDDPDPNR